MKLWGQLSYAPNAEKPTETAKERGAYTLPALCAFDLFGEFLLQRPPTVTVIFPKGNTF